MAMAASDLLIRNASLDGSDRLVDIAIDDGVFEAIGPDLDAEAERVIDVDGNFVSPGFADCHMHIDRAYAATGERKPKKNDGSIVNMSYRDLFDEYHSETSKETVEKRAIQHIERSVASGVLYFRSHVSVDNRPSRTENMEACLAARERTLDIADIQLVPYASRNIIDSEEYVREAIEMGLSQADGDSILVGGYDPGTDNNDIENSLDMWFEVAAEYDIDIDVHVQDEGTLGIYTLDRLMDKMEANGYEDRVTASHSYSLAGPPEWRVDSLLDDAADVGLNFITCYVSTRSGMPVQTMLSHDGVALGHGTDNTRDYIAAYAHHDVIEGAYIVAFRVDGDRKYAPRNMEERENGPREEYGYLHSNPGLELLWEMITEQSAGVLGIEDRYGIEEGNPADLVVLDEPSPQWALLRQANRPYVIKDGAVVAEDGEIRPEFKVN